MYDKWVQAGMAGEASVPRETGLGVSRPSWLICGALVTSFHQGGHPLGSPLGSQGKWGSGHLRALTKVMWHLSGGGTRLIPWGGP